MAPGPIQYGQCETPSGIQIVRAYRPLACVGRGRSGVALDASEVDHFDRPSSTFDKLGEENKVDYLIERQASHHLWQAIDLTR
jgi:hypothetical protein